MQLFFDYSDQHIGGHRYPNLRLPGAGIKVSHNRILADAQKTLDTQVLLDPLANAVCKVRQWATAANSYCWSETLAACRSSHPTHARLNHKLKLTVTSSNTYSDFHPIAFRSL